MKEDQWVTHAPWTGLKQFTDARIALGRTGASLPTSEHLSFQMSHAQARDAVHKTVDFEVLKQQTAPLVEDQDCLILHSAAKDRAQYLQRPDLGRILSEDSKKELEKLTRPPRFDFSLAIGDGLSAKAIETNVLPFLQIFLPLVRERQWTMPPPVFVGQCRVACGDEIASALHAQASVILIGERPGLSSPDSMGIYLTWSPEPGVTKDEKRNCISNIRPGGMDYPRAAGKLIYLLEEAIRRKISGVALKDEQFPAIP